MVRFRLQSGKKQIEFLLVMLIYLLLTLAFTYPLPLKMFSALAGVEARDNFQWVWFLWWCKKAWVELGRSPADLTFLYHPTGAYHPQLAAEAYTALLGLPLTLSFGPRFAYNFQILLSFFLSGVAMYLLGYYLTGDKRAAFIGGLIFAFYPRKTGHAQGGQFAQVTVYFYPLYALSLWFLLTRPNWRKGILCGSFLALSLLVSFMHVAYFVIPFTLFFGLYSFVVQRRALLSFHFLCKFALALILAFITVSPFLGPFLIDYLTGNLVYLGSGTGTVEFSLDLLAFFSPSRYHPLLMRWEVFNRLVYPITPQLSELTGYLGFIPLFLAAWGFKNGRQKGWFWLLLGLGAAILSLGPFLEVYGRLVNYSLEGISSYVVLPYALVKGLPFYKWGRTPARLNDLTIFCLAALACLGGKASLAKIKGRTGKAVLFCGLSLIILFEYIAIFPFPVSKHEPPAFYTEIATEAEDYAILDLPVEGGGSTGISNRAMYYQMFHHHRIINGFIHRSPAGVQEMVRFFSKLASPLPRQDIVDSLPPEERFRALRALGFKYLVIHKASRSFPKSLGFFHQVLGRPLYEDERIVAFALPKMQDVEVKELALLDEEDNWYGLDVVDGHPARWMSNDALVWFYETEPTRKRLLFTVLAWDQPELEVFINEQLVEKYRIDGERKLVTSPVALKKGVNRVRFHLPGRCLPSPRNREKIARPEVPAGDAAGPCITAQLREIRFLPAEAKEIQHPFEINLGGEVTFLGYDLRPETFQPGEKAVLILYWRAERQMEKNYTVFVHLLDGAVRKVSQDDGPPLEGVYPTSRWEVGEVVGDRHVLAIPLDAPPGEYELKIGLYRLDTMERLAVAGDTTGEAAISLGTIAINADK